VLERYTYYLRLLALTPDKTARADLALDRSELNEDNFDAVYNAFVGKYDLPVARQAYPRLQPVGASSPSNQSGARGQGQLYLNDNEDAELNTHGPSARDNRQRAAQSDAGAAGLALIPNPNVNLHFWGLGGSAGLPGGTMISAAGRIASDIFNVNATDDETQGAHSSKTASYQRRADEWMFQANLAARELMQIGRQIIGSLIAEQIAYHDYQTVKTQVQQAQEIQSFLETKFTNAAFYDWQTSEITRLYYQYYRFACDVARKAEQTMKRELMRPELDATQFIQFNYWDSGHKGLLSGEGLLLDLKRMEMAYHDNNKRELELTRHVSLRQLDPGALLNLKITGSCTVTIPEWLYDLGCPGHYLRRIKTVGVSVPSVVGPYTNVNCKLTLQKSTLRVSPLLRNNVYRRDTSGQDDRFIDYFGSAQSVVTSGGHDDSGMFETNLRDERFLPFEGAGAENTWTVALPPALRAFDYMTIPDVVLHVRYTARDGGDALGNAATDELKQKFADASSGLELLFSLRYDFSTEWSTFVNKGGGFTFTLRKDYFPYMVQDTTVTVDGLTLYRQKGTELVQKTISPLPANLGDLNGPQAAVTLTLQADQDVLVPGTPDAQIFLVLQYHLKQAPSRESGFLWQPPPPSPEDDAVRRFDAADGGTNMAQVTVADFGTRLGGFTDPTRDDNGPGSYVYPTNSVYVPGAFDLLNLDVFIKGTEAYFVARIRGEVTNPFGGDHISLQRLNVYLGTGSGNPVPALPGTNMNVATPWSVVVVGDGRFNQAGAYAPDGTKLASATLITVPQMHQIAVGIPLSALNGLDLKKAYYGTAMFGNCQTNEGIGFVRPVYSKAFWSNPGPGLGFITQFYFGGGTGQAAFDTPSNDTDTSDPNAIDIIVGPGQSQSEVLNWHLHSPCVLPMLPLGQ
jgi:hypothetical protein